MRNIQNDSIDTICQLYFTIHCCRELPTQCDGVVRSKEKEVDGEKSEEILVYQSEVVADTINPEWNELGSPIEIQPEYLNEKGTSCVPLGMCRVCPSCVEQARAGADGPLEDGCTHSGSGLHRPLEAD